MKNISSRQNPWFKRVRDAMSEHGGEIALEGPKQVADAIAGGWKPLAVIHRSTSDQDPAITAPQSVVFSAELFNALAETKSPQNVIALFVRPRASFNDLLQSTSVIVALDGVQDPGNVGTIVRLAAAFDCAGVALLPGSADAFSPKAIRASAGAVLTVPIVEVTAQELIDCPWPTFATDASGEVTTPPAERAILVFGNEGSGVSEAIRRVSTSIAVPTSGRIESLNVAASAAILLSRSFEARSTLFRG